MNPMIRVTQAVSLEGLSLDEAIDCLRDHRRKLGRYKPVLHLDTVDGKESVVIVYDKKKTQAQIKQEIRNSTLS